MSPAAQPDPYEVLGVAPTSSEAEIKSAYRALVHKLHPDHNPGFKDQAAARFREVNEAYEVLRDPARRARHDDQRSSTGGFASAPADAPTPELVWVFCSICQHPTVSYGGTSELCALCSSSYGPVHAPGTYAPEPAYAGEATKNSSGGGIAIALLVIIYLLSNHAS